MLLNYISIPVFLISFAIGLFFIYIYGPSKKIVYIYPSPENIDKILYRDKANNCFTISKEIINCPTNKSLINNIPLQE